jgi:hypothetical protein
VIGSFTVDGKTINVSTDYSHVDGRVYRLTDASSDRQVAFTTYRGLNVADETRFSKRDLQDGLRAVLRQASR